MFDKFVADLLTTYLGEYFDNIDREQVKVSVWNGRVHLRNLKVRRDALRSFDVPICVVMGTIEELTVVIPWTHLRSESVVVQIRNARLILSDKETALYDVDQEKREERTRKDRELAAADEALLAAFKDAQQKATAAPTPDTTADTSDNNFTARLKASILNNIRVEVEQLFVHYTSCVAQADGARDDDEEDAASLTALPNHDSASQRKHDAASPTASLSALSSTKAQQASLSFQIKDMKTCGCNERFEPAFVAPGERMSRQLVSFSGMAVSLRTGPGKDTEVPLLRPFNVVIELAYQPVVTDLSTPQYMVAVHMNESCACVLTSESCITCYALLRYLRQVRARQALRRLRPIGERPTAKPKQWWRYALDAVLQQVRQDKSASLASAHKPTPFSWLTYTSTKAKRDRYMVLYQRRQRVQLAATGWLEPLNVDEHVEMVVLEEELSVEILKLAKRLAMERAAVERTEYNRILRQKKATSAAAGLPSPRNKAATAVTAPEDAQTPASDGGWFSFWRSAPQAAGSSAGNVGGAADDGLDDETRAELRKLVQLMTAERWTDAQRAVIAQEFGMSAEEAQEMAQSSITHDPPGGATVSSAQGLVVADGVTASQRLRAAPMWVVFMRAASVSLELQSCEAETQALHLVSQRTASPARDTLAKLFLGKLQGGGEWGGGSGGSSDAALPLAYYWGSVEVFSVTAANLSGTESQSQERQRQQGEQEILSIGAPRNARDADSSLGTFKAVSPLAPRRVSSEAPQRRTRPFSPLESCWSILSHECRRTAAWQLEWTQRSPQQLVSRASAVHRVRARVAPMRLTVDVVPLRHLTDFFFTVMWPNANVRSGVDPMLSASIPSEFTTALHMPVSRPLTHIEQRCSTDADARLIILRRKVERQHSIEWDVAMDSVTVSLSEIPDVQGCELVVSKLVIRNDIVHRLQRQERLQSDVGVNDAKNQPAVLGSAKTDWIDYTHVEAETVGLAVFLASHSPSASAASSPSTERGKAAPSVTRHQILEEAHFAIVVERSLLGRCLPDMPPYKLCVSSSNAVNLSWSRSALSVLATSCSTLTDLAASVGETVLRRGGSAVSAAASDGATMESTTTFHVGVVPHLTHKAFWKSAEQSDEPCRVTETASSTIKDPDVYYKQMHPFSKSRLAIATGSEACGRRRVDIRRGVCVLYHPERLSFPAEYLTLQSGCTRVRRSTATGSIDDGDGDRVYVHLYVLQGGADQEEVFTDACEKAKQLLVETVGVPPALLCNAVWLESTVQAWILSKELAQSAAEAGSADVVQRVQTALEIVLKGAHLVPCQRVTFQCSGVEEAQTVEATLLRCCVEPSVPPLELTPKAQAEYNAAVVTPSLRKQPLWSAQIDFPSLRMTCEGSEPAPCCDELPNLQQNTKTAPEPARRDAVLSFEPFGLRYDRFAEKQRFELTVGNKTEMSGCSAHCSQTELPLMTIAQSPMPSPSSAPALFLRLVTYQRPQPLPSMKRCAIYVNRAASLKLRVGPALLESAEAWWDSFGLLTNRLYAEEVVLGHPWWSPSTTEPFHLPRKVEAAWKSEADYGGNEMNAMVDFSAALIEVEVTLPTPFSSFPESPLSQLDECAVCRFSAQDISLQWRLSEALNHVRMGMKRPVLLWRPVLPASAEPSVGWVTVMDAAAASGAAATSSDSALSVNWKLHKPAPMLSMSDWICCATADRADPQSPQQPIGFRDRQEMELHLDSVKLLYWHPLLLHMLQSVEDGVLRRAVTLTDREPCWFHGGVLYCPPLSWPHRGAPPSTSIAWGGLRKSISLQRVVLQMPEDLSWMVKRGTVGLRGDTSLAVACEIAMEAFMYSETLHAEPRTPASPLASPHSLKGSVVTPVTALNTQWSTVSEVHSIEFRGMTLRRCSSSSVLSSRFAVSMPHWTLTLTLPVFQVSSVWQEQEAWHNAFHVHFHKSEGSRDGARAEVGTSWKGTSDDLAYVLALLHASYMTRNSPVQSGTTAGIQPHREPLTGGETNCKPDASLVDTSPASLLKAVAETTTWILDVESKAEAQIWSPDAQNPAACVVELGVAHAVIDHSRLEELCCTLETQHILLGCAVPESGKDSASATGEVGARVMLLLSFPEDSTPNAFAASPLLRFHYGWRWLEKAADEGVGIKSNDRHDSAGAVGRALYASLNTTHGVRIAAHAEAFDAVRSAVQSASLRDSMSRFSAPALPSAAPATAAGAAVGGWQKIEVKLQVALLECQLPCFAPSPGPLRVAPQNDLRLCLTCSGVLLRLRKDKEDWRGMLNVSHLVRCVLWDGRAASPTAAAVPLVLEQPAGWSQPTASSPRAPRQAVSSVSPMRQSPQVMEAPKPTQQTLLDELFGELPSPQSINTSVPSPSPPLSESQTRKRADNSEPSPRNITSSFSMSGKCAESFLSLELAHTHTRSTLTTALKPLWLLTPSMTHMSDILTGVRQQMSHLRAALQTTEEARALPLAMAAQPTTSTALIRSFAVDVRLGAVSVFVLEKEAAVRPHDCTAQQAEDAVKRGLNSEALLLATEAVTVQWDSASEDVTDGQKRHSASTSPSVASGQPVLQIKNTSICALRGLHKCTVLLERFGIAVTRQALQESGAPPSAGDSEEHVTEKWKVSLDPLQLTLTQLHYAALLRAILQQTSFVTTLASSASAASQSLATAAAADTPASASPARTTSRIRETEQRQVTQKRAAKRFSLQVNSLSLRVEEDGEGAGTAVYVQLREFEATYYPAEGSPATSLAGVGRLKFPEASRGQPLRLAASLHSCLVGTEGAIPTFSLAPPSTSSAATPSLSLRITEDETVPGAKSGFVQVREVTVTVEAIPMMAWVDLLYAPYLQVAVPHYQTEKELVMQRDLWLSEDLVLTERTPLRAVNKTYSLLYLYGNGHTIRFNAGRRGQLILLEEGMTLRIMHAVVCMEGGSVEAYVSAGNGSYVVLDRETCTVVRPSDSASQQLSNNPLLSVDVLFDQDAPFGRANAGQQNTQQQRQRQMHLNGKWTELEGDVQIQLRVPEPRVGVVMSSAPSASSRVSADPAIKAAGGVEGAQRTLVVYSDMRLSLLNTTSAVSGASEMSGSFALAHSGVRSEFVTALGTTVYTSDLVSDWAMAVHYTEEKSLVNRAGGSTSERTWRLLRNVRVDASSGVEMRVQYSDVFFALRAAQHAQAAFAKWKGALRRDLWSSLAALPQSWDVAEVGDKLAAVSRTPDPGTGASGSRPAASPAETTVTKTSLQVQIPYLSFFAVDDSQNTVTPLFCVYINEIRTPNVTFESPHAKAEVQFTLQLDYYGLAKSQWAPVLDPLSVSLSLNWRQNTSVLDVYNREGFVRLAVQTGSVTGYFTLELLRNLQQLQLLRAKFEAAGVELFKSTSPAASTAARGGLAVASATSSSFHAFNMLQTTGVSLEARLPEYAPHPPRSGAAVSSSISSSVVASGSAWAFNLPRAQGKELPRERQKILVQLHTTTADTARGAVVSIASVGVQRVSLSTSGPLQYYVIADVSVQTQQQGQKQIHLHSTVLFQNELSSDIVQLAATERGTYGAVDIVPAGAARYVSVEVLRRRVCLALSKASKSALSQESVSLRPSSVVRLGMSYDALPCLANNVLLCISDAETSLDNHRNSTSSSARPASSSAESPAHLAKGKNFDICRGKAEKSYFLLRIQAASSQPSDVTRYAALAPLRAVTVVAEAAVTIHNAVGVPLTLTLLSRRVRPGVRVNLLDMSPDTTVYTVVNTTTLSPSASYGAIEMDPLEDVCLSVSLQQPNGGTLLQWSSQDVFGGSGGGVSSAGRAYYAPACVYCSNERGRRDGQIVLADPATGATLVLYIKYTKRVVTLYCPHWIVNETEFAMQLADTSSPHAGDMDRCANPIAGLGGRTVRTATVASWEGTKEISGSGGAAAVKADVHLYNSLRAESCAKNKSNAGANGLFVRVWEDATPDSNETPGFSEWSQHALSVHEVADAQVVTCASRRTRGTVIVLSCRVELGGHSSLHAYSDTRVVYIRPRWVILNKSPYTLCFSHVLTSSSRHTGSDGALVRVKPFADAVVPPFVANPASQAGRLHPLLSFAIDDDAQHNIQRCGWSTSLPINVVHEESTNLVYHSLIPLSEYWPQGSASNAPQRGKAAQGVPDSLPPLRPDDIKDINGDLFVDREETRVFSTTAYTYKGCMMCVEVEEALQPPIVIENRTSYTICFQQRGVRRVSTVFPRCRKAWTWDVPPVGPSTPAIVELWLAREQEAPTGAGSKGGRSASSAKAAPATCVLNFDPQLIDQHTHNTNGFQQELEVEDPVRGVSTMLFVRVRGVHGMSYAVSITAEPTIDAYCTLPYPQLSLALQVENVLAVLCGEDAQRVLLCSIAPLSFTFAQGARRRRDGAAAASDLGSGDIDVQRLQLRFKTFQVDDERSAAKERVVVQLVDDRESGFQIERKLLRTTPILCCSTIAVRLTPIELHIEDGFITAMMGYQEVVSTTWSLARSTPTAARLLTAATPTAAGSSSPPWKVDLTTALARAQHTFADAVDDGDGVAAVQSGRSHRPTAPLSSRVLSVDELYVDPILVSLSLYRSPGAADDPLWKIAGAASLLVGSTQDARLQWDAVQRRRVCDTIWHLFFLHRDAYHEQMRSQYMSLVNVMGLNTVRSFVSDLLNGYSDDPRDAGGSGGRRAARRQKPRVPLRRTSMPASNQLSDRRARLTRGGGGSAAAVSSSDRASQSPEAEEDAESMSSTTRWVQQVVERQLSAGAQRTVTVADVARSYPWADFLAVAKAAELRAFGGLALARGIAEMPATPRLSLRSNDGGGSRRMSTQDIAKAGAGAARVQCTRCVELEALRLRRMRDGAATPLPHPVRDGFVTWEEFAHHISWYEFVDMCSDDEVRTYASLVRLGASESSANVCVVALN